MVYINLGFAVILLSMAVLSRIFFSKYKGKGFFYPLAAALAKLIRKTVLFDELRKTVRQSETMSSRSADNETEKRLVKVLENAFFMILVLNIVLIAAGQFTGVKEGSNSIKRPETGDDPVTYSISIDKGGKHEDYSMEILPKEFDDKEFNAEAEKLYQELDRSIKGENRDLDNVSMDLTFPTSNDNGTLEIRWTTDEPEVINSFGRVSNRRLEKAVRVGIRALVTDGSHDKEYVWYATVVPYRETHWAGAVEEELIKLEENGRNDEYVVLPDKIDGASVYAGGASSENTVCKLFIFGIILIGIYIFAVFNRFHKKGLKRQEELLRRYSFFVSSLVLRIGAGLSVKETMIRIHRELKENDPDSSLYEELNYAVNGLNAGRDEKTVYTEMGRSTGVEEYSRLMTLICRNIERGNSNLLELLRREEKDAFGMRKNRAKKKGEEAAEKLLLPMFILLVAVVGIVMFPALKNF